MACKTEQENIELRKKVDLLEKKIADLTNTIYNLMTEKNNGTDTNKQNTVVDQFGS